MSLCNRCIDPGICCREIRLNVKPPFMTKLEALAWLASIHPAYGEIGLPFIPEYKDRILLYDFDEAIQFYSTSPLESEWVYSCPVLTPDGRCGDYENRPRLCRTFESGRNQPCVMFHDPCPSFELSDGN
jgi:Fe-S-cluster containining protein